MNPITNSFEPLEPGAGGLLRPDGTPVPTHWMQLSVGEVVTVKGCGQSRRPTWPQSWRG